MTSSTYVSRYERRVTLVVDALRGDHDASPDNAMSPDTAMSEDVARVLAVRVLDALDHIPETVR
jgi:hypothetical protein